MEAFTAEMERAFPTAIRADLRRFNATARETSRVDDALLVADWAGPDAREPATARRLDLLLETQTLRELAAAQVEWMASASPAAPRSVAVVP